MTSFPGDPRETVKVMESTEGADRSEETPKLSLGNFMRKFNTTCATYIHTHTHTQVILENKHCILVGFTLKEFVKNLSLDVLRSPPITQFQL